MDRGGYQANDVAVALRAAAFLSFLLAMPLQVDAAEPPSRMVRGALLYEVLPLDAIPAIDAPRFVDAKAARAFMREDEPVLGAASGGDAVCYSTWLLEHHEIVNDRLAGTPIAASW